MKKEISIARKEILEKLKSTSVLKKDVFCKTKDVFSSLKEVVHEVSEELRSQLELDGVELKIEAKDKGSFEVRLIIAGDTIIFIMHSNVFDFEKSHGMYRTSYVRNNPGKSYCGMINVYNFLTDSFKYKRENDLGYLVGRIFINQDLHFFVEGKKQVGFLFNDFQHSKIDKKALKSIVDQLIKYCLSFDLLTPPYNQVANVSAYEMEATSDKMKLRTGKRLGFKFQSE